MQDPVRATADDAVTSKLAASAMGYYEDPFAQKLAKSGPAPPKRMPIINRGTWARYNHPYIYLTSMNLLQKFIEIKETD